MNKCKCLSAPQYHRDDCPVFDVYGKKKEFTKMLILIDDSFPYYKYTSIPNAKSIIGQWIEVDTLHLFKDQFNTTSIPNVSTNGLRIHARYVKSIKNDKRIGSCRCNYCGKSFMNQRSCSCDKKYLEDLTPIIPQNIYNKRGYDMYGKAI